MKCRRTGTSVTQQYAYDAWGRLVGVDLNNNGQFADAGDRRFEIDALGRRVQETTGGMTTDLYYGDRWQVLEERTRSATAGEASAVPARRNVWSGGYVDELIAIDRDANGSSADGLESRVYVQQDANFNVTSLTDRQGGVVERYAYDAYGERTVLDANWDTDADGASDMAMVQGFQGARHDDGTRLVHQRNRDLHVVLGRWTRQDPKGYVDGPNLFAHVGSSPVNWVDPFGTDRSRADQLRDEAQIYEDLGDKEHAKKLRDDAARIEGIGAVAAGIVEGVDEAAKRTADEATNPTNYAGGAAGWIGGRLAGRAWGWCKRAVGLSDEASDAANAAGKTVGHNGDDAAAAARKAVGDAANAKGAKREDRVATIVGGKVRRENIKTTVGSTDIDVIGPNGELIQVGGPGKAKDLAALGNQLKVTAQAARDRGVCAQAYFARGTPEEVLKIARKHLGDNNVKIFDE